MAQMVAKAMAKENLSGHDKEVVDKLAKEYADELNNLGVRITNLEKKSDQVMFAGNLQLDNTKEKFDGEKNSTESTAKLELDITAHVNESWSVIGVVEGESDLRNNSTADTTLTKVYAEGKLFGASAKLGKFGTFDAENSSNGGLIIDTEVSGAEFTFGDKLSTIVTVGRLDSDNYSLIEGAGTSDYQALQFAYDANDKLTLNAGYYNIKNSDAFADGTKTKDKNSIWSAGLDYKVSPTLTLGGLYAASNLKVAANQNSDAEKAYSVQLTYKGAENENPHSYGIWTAYRQIGELATIAPTYDGASEGQKGFELGVDYMLAKNILAKVVYFDGEEINTAKDVNKIFGRLEFTF